MSQGSEVRAHEIIHCFTPTRNTVVPLRMMSSRRDGFILSCTEHQTQE